MKKKFLIPLASALLISSCTLTNNNVDTDKDSSNDTNQKDDNKNNDNNYISDNGNNNYDSNGSDTTITPNEKESYEDNGYTYTSITDYDSFIKDEVSNVLDNATLPSTYETLTDSKIEITKGGNYLLNGSYEKITLNVTDSTSVHLYFNNVTITSTSKAIVSDEDDTTTYLVITLLSDTVNEVKSSKNSFDLSTSLFINGSGELSVTSESKNAIKTSKNVYIKDSSLTLETSTYEEGHGISAEAIYGKDATIDVTKAGKDGLHAEIGDYDLTSYVNSSGFVYLDNITYSYYGYGDGIQADSFVYINKGSYDISSEAHFVLYNSEEAAAYEINDADDFKYKKSGDSYYKVASENRGVSGTYAMVNSVKGIKVGEIDQEDSEGNSFDIVSEYYLTYIKDATLTINTPDDSIHTNLGSNLIENSSLTISTLDQGIQSDGPTTITSSDVNILTSYEGIEGSSIHLNGEDNDISIVSSDDGMNAATDYLAADKDFYRIVMNINAGKVKVIANGDGLDSNGSININGGEVYVEGSSKGGDSPLDSAEVNENSTDYGIYINGGELIATGTNGMLESPKTSSKQNSIVYTSSTTFNKGDTINVFDSSDNLILTTTLTNSGNSMILSSPNFEIGESYKIYLSSSLLDTVTLSTTVTSNSNNKNNGNRPGNGNDKPGNDRPGGRNN